MRRGTHGTDLAYVESTSVAGRKRFTRDEGKSLYISQRCALVSVQVLHVRLRWVRYIGAVIISISALRDN